jgi:hypothetical protein
MEDDVSKYRPFPKTLKIPSDADLVYLGISVFGTLDGMYYERTTIPGIHKIFGMYSTHMILVCSATGANLITRTILEDGLNNGAWDMMLADVHPFYNIYALSDPLVYQDGVVGGHQSGTKWKFPSKKKKNGKSVEPLHVETVPPRKNYKETSIAYQVSLNSRV